MSVKKLSADISHPLRDGKRTWIEIDSRALAHNYRIFRGLIKGSTKLWAVVKSNAYGHGIFLVSRMLNDLGVDGFCVDSCIEAINLRKNKIKKPILVLGPTLPSLFEEAAKLDITLSVSTLAVLQSLARARRVPNFHLKFDTGMHRQGFYMEDLPEIFNILKNKKLSSKLTGAFTHFAAASGKKFERFTINQFQNFKKIIAELKRHGFENLIFHSANTGGTMTDPTFHLDAVRVGMGLYGYPPSLELGKERSKIKLKPILSWRTVITEIKKVKPGDYVGYDLRARVKKSGQIAVLPVGYWHGLPWSLSNKGFALIRNKKVSILGRVSMDLTVVKLDGVNAKVGDVVTLLGKTADKEINAVSVSHLANSMSYELLTRLNPLIERIKT